MTLFETNLYDTIDVFDLGVPVFLADKALAEGIDLDDLADRLFSRPLADTLAVIDAGFTRHRERVLEEDVLDPTDAIAKTPGKVLSDGLQIGDDPIGEVVGYCWTQALADTLELADDPARSVGRVLANTFGIEEGIAHLVGLQFTGTIQFAQEKCLAGPQLMLGEVLGMSEALAWQFGFHVAESLGLEDDLLRSLGRHLIDELDLTDAISKTSSKAIAETAVLGDEVDPDWIIGLLLSETVGLSDALAMEVGRVLTDNLSLTDARAMEARPAFGETLVIAEALIKETGMTLDDAIEIVEAATRAALNQVDSAVRSLQFNDVGRNLWFKDVGE